jgi:hypothetical protein
MKNLFKILVILVVAIMIGGMFYGAVTALSSGTDQTSMPERPADAEFTRPDGDDAGGMQFPFDMVKNLAIISIISAVYLNATKWLGRKKSVVKAAL